MHGRWFVGRDDEESGKDWLSYIAGFNFLLLNFIFSYIFIITTIILIITTISTTIEFNSIKSIKNTPYLPPPLLSTHTITSTEEELQKGICGETLSLRVNLQSRTFDLLEGSLVVKKKKILLEIFNHSTVC